jgi:hypothetical protein
MVKTAVDYMDKAVVCPFYILEEKQKIRCEGYCEGTSFHIRFDGKEKKKLHKQKYCKDMKGYENCPLYPAINEQYEEDEDE